MTSPNRDRRQLAKLSIFISTHNDTAPRRRPYASTKLAIWLSTLTLLAGLYLAVAGVVQPINEATRPGAPVTVAVQVRNLAGLQVQDGRTVITADKLVRPDADRSEVQLQVPAANRLTTVPVPLERVHLRAWEATRLELFLSEADRAATGLCFGLGALLLSRLLGSIAAGRPFDPANPRRIAIIAALVFAGGYAGQVLPVVAGQLVLDRLGLSGGGSPVFTEMVLGLGPVIVALFVLALAEAFRRGSLLARDIEGLV